MCIRDRNKGNTQIFKEGVLQTYLYDCYSARKDKALSTGNAVRASYKSTPSVGVSNFYMKPSKEKSFSSILKSIDDGFYIIDIIGLHSGANPVTGDISVGAKGLWIKNAVSYTHLTLPTILRVKISVVAVS